MKTLLFILLFLSVDIVVAQYPNIRINHPSSTTPEEVTIAINPTDPSNVCAGANIDYVYYSFDGGYHWTEQHLVSSDFGVWGDPCVVFDAGGNGYFAHLSNPPSSGYWIDRIVVQRTTDGGATWNTGAGIGYNPPVKNQDKEWLGVDGTASLYRNNIYIAWTEFDKYGSYDPTDSSRILFSRSTDAGISWSSPLRVSDDGGNCVDSDSTVEGAVPAIGPDGGVYLSWSGPKGIVFDKSTDGGSTFNNDIYVTSHPGGWDFNVSGIYRCNGMPVTACDVGHSAYRGNIYIQWSDQRYGEENTDVFIIRSTDKGATWGSVIRVNDDTTARQQFFSWMTIDQATGNLYVVFYDRRNTHGDSTEVYVARSTDGGESFQNLKVSSSAFVPQSSVFFGDYTNIAANNGLIYPVWMRLDQYTLSVWTALMDERTTKSYALSDGWNLISLSQSVPDPRKSVLFGNARSSAFTYSDRYVINDSLEPGRGYWIKYDQPEIQEITGALLSSRSIDIKVGWNLIGSISSPVAVTQVGCYPPGIVVSGFYEYHNSQYVLADSLMPGKGYWVKSDQPGTLFLVPTMVQKSASVVTIQKDAELPPLPPSNRQSTIPAQFVLEQNYPNPFNPSTTIRYTLPARSFVTVKIFNVLGQEVARLVNEYEEVGTKSVLFDGRNIQSGVYYYQITAGIFNQTKKMVLIK